MLANSVVMAGNFKDLSSVKVLQPKRPSMAFTDLYEFDSEKAIISGPQHNGDWSYRFVIRIQDWREQTCDSSESKWNVSLCVVSPQAAGLREVMKAVNSFGYDSFDFVRGDERRSLFLHECLLQYGVYARLTDEYGDNQRKLVSAARQEAFKAASLFGFYMDRRQNAFGDSGWDFVSGNIAGSKDRDHKKWLEAKGLTEDQYEEQREARLEETARQTSVPSVLDPYVGGKKAVTLKVAHLMWRAGKLDFVERFVGGFADRGGSWQGPDERLGVNAEEPYGQCTVGGIKEVLRRFKRRQPKARFIVSLDESEQFQTYWSLWRIK